jgi:hypothetical protein
VRPISRHFIPILSKCFQCSDVKHPQSMFLPLMSVIKFHTHTEPQAKLYVRENRAILGIQFQFPFASNTIYALADTFCGPGLFFKYTNVICYDCLLSTCLILVKLVIPFLHIIPAEQMEPDIPACCPPKMISLRMEHYTTTVHWWTYRDNLH